MKHAKTKIRFIETFAIATLPIALAVGCSTTGQKTAGINMQDDVAIQQETDIGSEDMNTVTYLDTETAAADTQASEWPAQESMPEAESQDLSQTMQTAEVEESTVESGSLVEETPTTMEVNLQVPEIPKAEKPKTNIFHFAFNKFDVDEQDYLALKEHADYLLENPDIVVNVNGYSDNRGTAKNNVEISKRRAKQVAKILMSQGVPESQIKVNGYGESFPLNDEKNWDENRRVELIYPEEVENDGLIVSAF